MRNYKFMLLALMALASEAQAQSPAEYVKAVEANMNFVQFIGVLKCGSLSATIEVRASGVSLGNKSYNKAYDDAVLLAASKALQADTPTGIMFDVVYSTGISCSSLMFQSE